MSASQNSPAGPTLDQQRAAHAWRVVQAAKQKTGVHAKQNFEEFRGQAKKLPVRIMASGLGQALAFLKAKGYAPGLIDALSNWVAQRMGPDKNTPTDLLERIIGGNADFLRRATDEVLAYLQWLNRFAEAEKLVDDEGAD